MEQAVGGVADGSVDPEASDEHYGSQGDDQYRQDDLTLPEENECSYQDEEHARYAEDYPRVPGVEDCFPGVPRENGPRLLHGLAVPNNYSPHRHYGYAGGDDRKYLLVAEPVAHHNAFLG